MARRRDPHGRRAFAFSLVLHSALFVLAWMSTLYEPERMEFVSYEIELVSPAPAQQADEMTLAAEELVVETPEPEPEAAPDQPEPEPEPEPEPTPPPEPETDPEPEPEPEQRRPEQSEPAEERPPETSEETTLATTPEEPVAEETESGEGINVRLEGVRRDYPAYYGNIIRQIQRCFRWQGGGSWETTVYFVIRRDGTTADIDFVSRSGNSSFDFEAMGAIDCAGRGAFGPLPEDLPFDRLPIQFSFRPTGT